MSKPEADGTTALADLALSAANHFFDAWFVMLLFGVLHASDRAVPAFGYWQSLFLAYVAIALVGSGNFSVMQRMKKLTPMYGKKEPTVQIDAKTISDILAKYAKTN